ncbi:flagellar motor switch protein [Aestuariivita sp.]|uniref:flagellar motor switch protein n=1 Tax=Aestuariivita sp. TaxID=1872407 RepID=UPI00216CB060|nr:flagellar motor switch protein [Aestuariivita sp.]MCE8008974.1 flagellar motor switch protein [Aestuariivita sp.]
MAAMITDAVIIIMLIGGITFAQIVNQRVKRLMALLHELEPAVQQFSQAVDKSEASVVQMQRSLSQGLAAEPQVRTGAHDLPDEQPLFSSRRVTDVRDMGVRVIRDKQDLVRRFFDATRSEGKA